jgi:hypothetical protein
MNGPKANWGQPIAYHPLLAKFFGSVNASIFFGQLAYWEPRAGANRGLGVYKSAQEWTDETGLSYREQTTARRILVDAGYMAETHRRLEHRIYFRIEWDCFNEAFGPWVLARGGAFALDRPNDENAVGEIHGDADGATEAQAPNDENAVGGVRNRRSSIGSKTSAETTSRKPPQTPEGGNAGSADAETKSRRTPAVGINTWLAAVNEKGEKAIPDGDPIFVWAEKVGLPMEFLSLAWREFKRRSANSNKRQSDWRRTFRNCVEGNWYHLWWVNGETYQLTSNGVSAKKFHESEAA